MKICIHIFLALFLLASCSSSSVPDPESDLSSIIWTAYGDSILDLSNPIPAEEAGTIIESGNQAIGLFKAEIVQSCMTMGCWMSVKGPEGDTTMVFMKDHAFFVPKDSLQGNMAVFNGEAYYDTLSVAFQKHLLDDAGASQEEIDAIREPTYELAFEASGVRIANVPPGAPMAGE